MHIFVGETHIFYHFPTGVSFGEPGSLRIENPNDQRQAIRTPPKAAATAPAARVGALLFFGRVGGHWETAWYNADAQICPNIIT